MKCGAELPEGAAFCPGCGAKAAGAPEAAPEAAPVAEAPAVQDEGKFRVLERNLDHYVDIAGPDGAVMRYWERPGFDPPDYWKGTLERWRNERLGRVEDINAPGVVLVQKLTLRDTDDVPEGQFCDKLNYFVEDLLMPAIEAVGYGYDSAQERCPELYCHILNAESQVLLGDGVTFLSYSLLLYQSSDAEYCEYRVDGGGRAPSFNKITPRFVLSAYTILDERAAVLDVYRMPPVVEADESDLVWDVAFVEKRGLLGAKKVEAKLCQVTLEDKARELCAALEQAVERACAAEGMLQCTAYLNRDYYTGEDR